jgi:predicted RNA-binding protein YlxR (DUF448 family)
MWGQYSLESSDEGMRIGRESQGQTLLSTNTLVFGDNTEDRVKVRNYEPFGTGQPLDIKIQVGGFTAPVDQVDEDVETTRQVENKTAGRGEYVIYTDEQIAELKAANLWNEDMQKRQDEAVQKEQAATSKDAPEGSKVGKIAGKAGKLLGPAGAVLTLTAADMTRQAVTSKLQAMEVPKPIAEVGGFVAGATEFMPVAPSDTADVTPDMFSERPVERAAAEDEVARRGLEDLGMVTEPSRPGNKKGAPAPDSFLTMSP